MKLPAANDALTRVAQPIGQIAVVGSVEEPQRSSSARPKLIHCSREAALRTMPSPMRRSALTPCLLGGV